VKYNLNFATGETKVKRESKGRPAPEVIYTRPAAPRTDPEPVTPYATLEEAAAERGMLEAEQAEVRREAMALREAGDDARARDLWARYDVLEAQIDAIRNFVSAKVHERRLRYAEARRENGPSDRALAAKVELQRIVSEREAQQRAHRLAVEAQRTARHEADRTEKIHALMDALLDVAERVESDPAWDDWREAMGRSHYTEWLASPERRAKIIRIRDQRRGQRR
jgi:hypothetical protein